MENKRSYLFYYFLLITIILLWSYGWVLTKVGLEYMGPFSFAALRFILASFAMIIVLMFVKSTRPKGREWIILFIVGLLQTTAMFLLINYGMMFVSVSKSSILIYSMPIWSGILGYIFLHESLSYNKIISFILGILGLISIIGFEFFSVQNTSVIFGESLLLLAAISWASANVLVKKYFSQHNKIVVSTWQMIFGTIGVVAAAIIMEWGQPIQVTPMSIFILFYTGIIASSFCFTCWYVVLTKLDTTVASISLLFVPLVAIFLDWLLFGVNMTINIAIGAMLITLGVYLATVVKPKEKAKSEQSSINRKLSS
ncbi:DMT family transporter [Cytobacillus firmus]|uniref:Permease of the drug/metabolite transporter (DMT) superfamily n=1 Tax=Cytobacillus firmus TaxID=1399 RepID=A0A800MXJ3_CYTFI|nr:DMT family transporter [Cytobacillus firmus]KAF0824294.1 Permease of the drug/metabolite transporter (DMT) superfamily [Cytobacillus firmus]